MKQTIILLLVGLAFTPLHAQDHETLRHGLAWVFFNQTNLTRPENTGYDGKIDLDTGTTYGDYAKFWCGYLRLPVTGEITIEAEADNGLRLTLNKKLVIDGWEKDSARECKVSGKEEEFLPLQLEYFQDGGTAFCRLFWKWKGHERELIPVSAFVYDEKDQDLVEKLKSGEIGIDKVRAWK